MNLPPISALEMLDALARTGSVAATASELNLSPSAVSHKLRTLEARLGFRLAEAQGRGLRLTGEAHRYVAAIRPGLAALRDAHRGIGAAGGTLDLAVTSGLAATWLAPRLRRFLGLCPDVALTLSSFASGEEPPRADLWIGFTDSPPPGAELLLRVAFFPVCAPELLYEGGGIAIGGLRPDMLLHLDGPADWGRWLEAAGSGLRPGTEGISFTGLLAMYAAAEAGLGLCLGDSLTCARALSTGRLVRPFGTEMPARAAYWIAPPPGGASDPAQAFIDWIKAEIAA
ncbi:LysR substrate-binding domain-containing protein [Mangrovicoccus sp. HB161399]|uniref:LysR substrate-binding domain-containing protein n=1 Tax=Mangrovicoccus sp. HB161399 TaxID=2720392 RepID=UPI001557460F|nr:LysR substrate-binding domain-containing protein [Mangrovicoccus sp. HB161399]